MRVIGLDMGHTAIRAGVPEGEAVRVVSVAAAGEPPGRILPAGLAPVEAGGAISAAVLTVPAAAPLAIRIALREAALRLGLTRIRLVPAPVAAALPSVRRGDVRGRVVVIDVGATALGVVALQVEPPHIEVLAQGATAAFSGRHLDAATADLLAELSGPDASPEVRRAAARAAQAAREALTDHFETRVVLEPGPGAGRRGVKLSRDQLEQRVRPLLLAAETTLREVLAEAAMRPEDCEHVLIVGGCAYMPLVRRFASFLRGRTRVPEVPETRAAEGAAVYAQSLWGGAPPLCVTGPLPYPILAAGLEDVRRRLMPRSAVVPATATFTGPAEAAARMEAGAELAEVAAATQSAEPSGVREDHWAVAVDANGIPTVRRVEEAPEPPALPPEAPARRLLPALQRDAGAVLAALTALAAGGLSLPSVLAEAPSRLDAALARGDAVEAFEALVALDTHLEAAIRAAAALRAAEAAGAAPHAPERVDAVAVAEVTVATDAPDAADA